MNRDTYNEYLMEIILAFILPITVGFIYDVQIRVFKYDSGLWLFLLCCIGECILAIIINKKKVFKNIIS